MRAVIQRVCQASVTVEERICGQIGPGLLVLLGIGHEDSETIAARLATKLTKLRIFEDENGKMNRSVADIGGQVLVVSQFTLLAETRKSGNRPSFSAAARPEVATPLYNHFCQCIVNEGVPVETGQFGAHMQVHLTNEGPVTLILDLDEA